MVRNYFYQFKRFIDFVGAAIALILLSPLLLFVALVVRIKMGSPVLFKQVRPGLHGLSFTLFKFRTMTDRRDNAGNLLPDQERLTPFGRFMRKTSLDELPELVNVLKGDMSLVGPRPLLMRYQPYYNERERIRFTVRPGITGLAQISGRNLVSWDERLQLDIDYVENLSLALDMRIILQTFGLVLKRSGVVESPNSVMLDLDEERKRRVL